jgi:glycosyltransferase involved in cell wall biosynthesis
MLNPGPVGLSALDSFALGLPMVTCSLAYHGPEFAYLVDGTNAVVLAEGSEPRDFAAVLASLLTDSLWRASLVQGCDVASAEYSIEGMAQRFASGVMRVLRS